MTETRRQEIKDYGQSLMMMPHGGSVPARMLVESADEIAHQWDRNDALERENAELRETIAVLRTPSVSVPERE